VPAPGPGHVKATCPSENGVGYQLCPFPVHAARGKLGGQLIGLGRVMTVRQRGELGTWPRTGDESCEPVGGDRLARALILERVVRMGQ
jgi:hypothetical protein